MIRTRRQHVILFCILASLTFQGCQAAETIEDIEASEPIIEIRKGHTMPGIKNAYDVILDRRITEAEIEDFAHRILRASPLAERTFIAYSLRGMELGNGAWATSHFNPDLRVDIMELFTGNNPPDEDLRLPDPYAAWVEYRKQKESDQ